MGRSSWRGTKQQVFKFSNQPINMTRHPNQHDKLRKVAKLDPTTQHHTEMKQIRQQTIETECQLEFVASEHANLLNSDG